jgi:hypothetical protein
MKTGISTHFDNSLSNRAEVFSFNFTGYINVPVDGQYTFYTLSDDGSMLYIDNKLVVNNDKIHYNTEKSGTIGLKAGKHAISVGYFQQSGGKILIVSYAGPSISKQVIPASALFRVSEANFSRRGINNIDQAATVQLATDQTLNTPVQIGIKAYPNPFVNSLNITITGDMGDYKIMMIDVLGRTLWAKNGIKNAGTFKQSVNTSALEKGIYFLRVIQNNNNSVIKMEK